MVRSSCSHPPIDGALQGLKEKGQVLLEQMSNQASWTYGKEAPLENKDNVDHIHSVMEDMQLRKQRLVVLHCRAVKRKYILM